MATYNYIGVVDDGRTVGGSYLYRVNYGTFAVPLESTTPLTIAECKEWADELLASQTDTVAAPVPERADKDEIDAYLNAYYQATRQLITIATGTTPAEWVKLEDAEYQQRAQQAALIDPVSTQLIINTLMYSFFQLKLHGLNWDDFAYPEA